MARPSLVSARQHDPLAKEQVAGAAGGAARVRTRPPREASLRVLDIPQSGSPRPGEPRGVGVAELHAGLGSGPRPLSLVLLS